MPSILAAAIAVVLSAPAPAAASDLPWLPHERYRLPNGLEVVLHDDDRYPLVAVRLIYHVGSLHDPPGKQGVAHLLEHTMFSGSTHVGDGAHFSTLWRAGASMVNAYTWPTRTEYVENLPAIQLDVALWLESDRMGWFDPRLHRRDLEKERAIVIQEIAQRRQGGELALATTGLLDLIFPEGHPMHDQDRRTLQRITLDDVDAMSSRYYGPANATLILAGDLPDDVRTKVEHWFGSLEGGERPSTTLPPIALTSSPAARMKAARSRVPVVLVAWPSPGLFGAGDAEAAVLAGVLDARNDNGSGATQPTVITGIDAAQLGYPGQSVFMLEIEGRSGATPAAMLAEIDGLLARVAGGELTELEVRVAARRLATAIHRSLGSAGGRADAMARYISAGKPPDWVSQDEQRYRRVTRITVTEFARTWLHRRHRAIVQIDPSVAVSR